jgi:hypothetical protein
MPELIGAELLRGFYSKQSGFREVRMTRTLLGKVRADLLQGFTVFKISTAARLSAAKKTTERR